MVKTRQKSNSTRSMWTKQRFVTSLYPRILALSDQRGPLDFLAGALIQGSNCFCIYVNFVGLPPFVLVCLDRTLQRNALFQLCLLSSLSRMGWQ